MALDALRWLLPLAIGGAGVSVLVVAVVRGRDGWSTVAALFACVALLGAGVFSKVELSKDGFAFETLRASAQNIADLQKAVEANNAALTELTQKVNDVAQRASQVSSTTSSPQDWKPIIDGTQNLKVQLEKDGSFLDATGDKTKAVLDYLNSSRLPGSSSPF
jgi:hypothetical protein